MSVYIAYILKNSILDLRLEIYWSISIQKFSVKIWSFKKFWSISKVLNLLFVVKGIVNGRQSKYFLKTWMNEAVSCNRVSIFFAFNCNGLPKEIFSLFPNFFPLKDTKAKCVCLRLSKYIWFPETTIPKSWFGSFESEDLAFTRWIITEEEHF